MSTSGGYSVYIPTPISVANGGTGGATLPSGAVIIGNGSGAVNSVATGSNGNVLVVVGGVWTSAPPAAAGAPANGTYIVQVPNGSLPNAQSLSALTTGILKSTTITGVLSIATGSDLPVHSAALLTSGQVSLAQGGSGADLSLTGGANQIVRQNSAGGVFTVSVLAAADIPSLAASKITTGQLALARGGTGVDLSASGGANFVMKQAAGGVISSSLLVVGDIPSLPASQITSGTFTVGLIPSLPASQITSGQLALARGGTNADLSATGGANQFLKQVTAAGAVTVAVISASDIASALSGSSIAFSTITGIVPIAQGGTGVTLAATGGANQFLRQSTVGGNITVSALAVGDIPNLPASQLTSGQLAVARGGSNADLSATGGANQFIRQSTVGGAFTVSVIAAADIATALTTSSIAFSTVTGIVPIAQGGAGVSLAGTGGANQFVKQSTLGGTLTVAGILSADLTTALTTPPAIGGTTPAAITGTTGVFNTSIKSPLHIPSADSTTAIIFTKSDGSTAVVTIDTTNSRLGVGTTPTATFHGVVTDTNTASSINMIALAHNLSSGTAAAGIGVNITFAGNTSGAGAAANTAIGKIDATFNTTNHATRSGTVTFSANYTSTAQSIIAISGDAAGYGKLAFFGQPGHAAYGYSAVALTQLTTPFTGTVLDATAAKVVDLNSCRVQINNLIASLNQALAPILGYGLMFDQS